jgi:hypothetical protein
MTDHLVVALHRDDVEFKRGRLVLRVDARDKDVVAAAIELTPTHVNRWATADVTAAPRTTMSTTAGILSAGNGNVATYATAAPQDSRDENLAPVPLPSPRRDRDVHDGRTLGEVPRDQHSPETDWQ